MDKADNSKQTALADLHNETARIPWCELQRFFASGVTVAVEPGLDLVEVALQMSRDNKQVLAAWMEGGEVGLVSDDQARQWLEEDCEVWSVVVKPWVLVQAV